MKQGIHPEYYESTVRCACGAEVTTKTTMKDLHVEICSQCHPFFTGKQKLLDTAGRIEKFNRKYGKAKPDAEQAELAAKQTEPASPQ